MSSAMIPVWIYHHLECFDFRVDILNDYPFSGKPFIICFFTLVQLVILTRLFGYLTVAVEFFYPQIPEIRLYQYRLVNPIPYIVLSPALCPQSTCSSC
jgi:hypothetical protein